MINTSFINTLLLMGIIGVFVAISIKLKHIIENPVNIAKIQKTYDNICAEGIPITIKEGEFYNGKLPIIGDVVIPDKNAVMKVPINCN